MTNPERDDHDRYKPASRGRLGPAPRLAGGRRTRFRADPGMEADVTDVRVTSTRTRIQVELLADDETRRWWAFDPRRHRGSVASIVATLRRTWEKPDDEEEGGE